MPEEVGPPLANGRYHLVEVLGQGGMATVYRAHDEWLDVHRAVKVLAPHLTQNPKIRTRFQSEARTMAKLQHANVVALHDVGFDDDRLFMVMEIVEGGSLMDLVTKNGGVPPRQACEIAMGVLSGLHAAHAMGAIHRDIKPHNVLMTPGGVPKVTDFGIAHLANTDQSLTRTGAVLGTWAYMAPEQKSSAKEVDARADVYAVAATLYAAISNKEPFDLYATDLHEELFQGFPEPVAEVIKKGTRSKADQRWESAAAMREALAQVIEALPPDPPDRVATPAQPPPAGPTAIPPLTGPPDSGPVSQGPVRRSTLTPPAAPFATPLLGAAPATLAQEADTATSRAFRRVVVGEPMAAADGGRPAPDESAVFQKAVFEPSDEVVRATAPSPEGTIDREGPEQRSAPRSRTISDEDAPTRTGGALLALAGAGGLLVAFLAVVVVAIGAWVFLANGDGEPAAEPETRAAPPPAEAPPAEPAPPAEKPETASSGTAESTAAQPKPSEATSSASKPTAASSGTGKLLVNMKPYGTVSVDGGAPQRTPWSGKVKEGKHKLVLEANDGRSTTETVSVSASQEVRFCWDFDAGGPCQR